MADSTPTVGFVSLGCPKALVDSERIITRLRAEGYQLAPDFKGADLVIVNTCGFIDSAIEESMNTIGEALAENGKVIVTGCMGRNPERIIQAHPSVLGVTGPQAYEDVMAAVHTHLPPRHDPYTDLIPPHGIKLTPRHYAYLKISEGCNNSCSFCIIPNLRGKLVSRPIDEVLREAEQLAAAGVRELLVISQDTSAYGSDIKYRSGRWRDADYQTRLIDLCRALGELGIWVRLHYVYPYPHVNDIIPLMAEGRILPYLDIPFQHASPAVLKRMRRPAFAEDTLRRIERWREICPDLTLRSSFVVGFPGETEEDFEYLLDWLDEAQIDRVGCFTYSAVEGAVSNALPDHVPEELKQERFNAVMELARDVSARRLSRYVGREIEVMVDEVADGIAIARSRGDAPEIDGVVRFEADASVRPGTLVTVEVVDSDDYDLEAFLPEAD
ncbi:MAG: 30S ribosomal protein S12 methylthiotransferase RimO [Gammaproteobacteria bacterium]|nr:30S ribosomal protein S12 methylthiotransferase RimO [Gammaproteobacteria bacterium]